MTLLQSLLNSGIQPHDAQVLDEHYAHQDVGGFLDGLEEISRILAFQAAPMLIPLTTEPWRDIHLAMVSGGDTDQAFNDHLATLSADLQLAIAGAVTRRMSELRQWQQQMQGQGKKRKTAEYIGILKRLGYSFRYNQCKLTVEVNGKPLTDMTAFEIRTNLRDNGVYDVHLAEEAYMTAAWSARYHPMREYLLHLKYLGDDPINSLALHFMDSDGVFATWLRRWCVGAVARVLAQQQNRMLVLEGGQNIGKDYFARWLCSGMPEYFRESGISPDDKDHKLYLLSTWIWDAQELGATTRRADREALKSFLTLSEITERQAYGRFPITGPVMTSFIGTANNESGLLNDPTGNRRFMIAHLESIDWDYAVRIDVDQVWAQAVDLYMSGESWNLQPDELVQANEINERYTMIDIVEETVLKFFDIDAGNHAWFMSTLDILSILKSSSYGDLKPGTELDTRRLAAALTRLGLDRPERIRLNGPKIRGYFGIRVKSP